MNIDSRDRIPCSTKNRYFGGSKEKKLKADKLMYGRCACYTQTQCFLRHRHTETPGRGKTQEDTQKNMATTTGPDVKPGQLYENFIKHHSTLKRF